MQLSFKCRYKLISKIGEGSFADVLKCQESKTGTFYACKRLKKIYLSSKQMLDIPEIVALQKMGYHMNLLHLIETAYEPNPGYIMMVFELCDMSLYDLMKTRKRGVPENQARDFTYQILRGIEFIHNSGIFHRDIKPENILLKGNIVKIADLGSVRGIHSNPPYTEYISTRWYRSPECLLTTGYYGPKMDVWAVGCVFYELLTLKPLFPGANEMDQISRIHSLIGIPSTRTMEKFRKYKSYNYEWALSLGKMKSEVKNRSDHWGCGFYVNRPRENITSTSLPSFHQHLQGSFGHLKLFTMLTRISEDGRDVLKQMLLYDPDLRSSAHRALEHRYFNVHRVHETTPRNYHCCSEVSRTKKSQSGSNSKNGSTESLPRKYYLKPAAIADTKAVGKQLNKANKKEEVHHMHNHNNSFYLPMLPAKYREQHNTDTSNCKGIGKYNFGGDQNSNEMAHKNTSIADLRNTTTITPPDIKLY
ncbi:MAPK/MAK/MRK overlapping kinase-like isoform X2 [Hetaerina americana]|uniref:MAPK/MAK/MRK overlapping kinase-like isoform X2 n=1 Tax=Hetaerina americana TaxID=62018 RepID=UPI003A7F40EE